jgi:hypothetical protein
MGVATAQAAQKAYFLAVATTLPDADAVLAANYAIERWDAAATTLANQEAQELQSYSISGRSASYKEGDNMLSGVAQLLAEVRACLSDGNVSICDNSQSHSTGGRV